MDPFPPPIGGASLILSFKMHSRPVLIVGGKTLAACRAYASLEADATVMVLAKGGLNNVCEEIRWRAQHGQLEVIDWDRLPIPEAGSPNADTTKVNRDMAALDLYLANNPVSLVFVTDTTSPSADTPRLRATQLASLCRAHRIPVNISEMVELCDFSFTAAHRFVDPVTSSKSPLQIGVTTNEEGCNFSGRIQREIIAGLPKDVGVAAIQVGQLRKLAMKSAKENKDPVEGSTSDEGSVEETRRQSRWVSQVSEYWPISRLATMTEHDMKEVLDGEVVHNQNVVIDPLPPKQTKGRIILAALTKHADIVLSDKLVPALVLQLIPSHVEVRIAHKFPGDDDIAQTEMMVAAVEAANRGLTVVRLKQGDPTVYARVGEELTYFRAHGFAPLILPGLSSALAAPACAGIPITHSGVATSFVVCTPSGRQGMDITLPSYDRLRTVLLLMSVAKLDSVVRALVSIDHKLRRDGPAYPAYLPIAIIERGSMPDQRVLVSTLEDIESALAAMGGQRPPGMMMIGWSVLLAFGCRDGKEILEDVDVDADGQEQRDRQCITTWLGDRKWHVWEGLDEGWGDI